MAWLLACILSAPPALSVEVFVPLCDGAQLACGRGELGDPTSVRGNLYWGAMYGAERHLARADRFRLVGRRDHPRTGRPSLLRDAWLVRAAGDGEREVHVTLHAYDGRRIDDALADFFRAASAGAADLVAWAGHDRLMDVPAPPLAFSTTAAPVAVLACSSERYFGPPLRRLGARPVALTRTFMAPEGYLLEALVVAVARAGTGDRVAVRTGLVQAYARYQRVSTRAASTVFTFLD